MRELARVGSVRAVQQRPCVVSQHRAFVVWVGGNPARCDSVRDFIKSLLNVKDLPILLQDERMSTMAIEKPMILADLSRKKRSSRTDQLAACWILQSALEGLQKKM